MTIKSQIIADFFADRGENQYLPPAPDSTYWRMNFDGSKMLGGLGADVVFTSPKGDKLQYVLQIHFCASNNVAEYEALVHGLKLAKEIGIQRILCFGNFDLVVHQVSGEWDAKDANMASYRFYVQQFYGFFEGCQFHHVPRANNDEADWLSKIGCTKQDIPAGVSLEIIRKPSIKPSPKSISIYVPEDPALAQMPPPDSGAAASGLKEAAGQPSVLA
jgi:ribonuclease HI